jgi:hypothetical protein
MLLFDDMLRIRYMLNYCRPRPHDSTYSKSSSISNLSPFGTLRSPTTYEGNYVQEFSHVSDQDDEDINNEGESLILSDSNAGSFSRDLSFASV